MNGPTISVAELVEALSGAEPPVVLDASLELLPPLHDGDHRSGSGRGSWLERHVPGSRHVDLATQFSDTSAAYHYAHPAPEEIADELAGLGIAAAASVVVYDSTGSIWASRLWYLLRWIGVDVRVLDGGLAAWIASGQPVVAGEEPVPSPVAPWQPRVSADAWITREELLERDPDDPRTLVCSLAAGAFSGTVPTRYSRRGRIPGSVNVPSRDLFTAVGTVRAADEIIAEYDSVGATGETETLLYCGGGISASAGALALVAAGRSAVRIYDGSLEEWSADPALPLELG